MTADNLVREAAKNKSALYLTRCEVADLADLLEDYRWQTTPREDDLPTAVAKILARQDGSA